MAAIIVGSELLTNSVLIYIGNIGKVNWMGDAEYNRKFKNIK